MPRSRSRGRRRRAASRSRSASGGRKEKKQDSSAKWICGTCAGPHRTKECPLNAGGASAMGTMMGLTMPPGMPPMGFPGMPTFPGMPGMMPPGMMPPGMAPPGMLGDGDKGSKKRKKGDKHRRPKEGSSADGSGSEEGGKESEGSGRQEPRRRRRRRSRSRTPERIEEVEKFLDDNRINEEATQKIRALSPQSQRKVIARPLTGDVQNPSKVMIARVRELQSQNERMKGQDMWSAWGGAMMGATPEAINKYIEEHDLDESATRQLRSLPPHHQAAALQWDLSKYRNPSAKFMSMANGLSTSMPRGPPTMPTMPGMPPFMTGMPPTMPPPGMMPGMMPPGMMPPGMMGMPTMPPPGMPPAARESRKARSMSDDI